MFEVNFDDGIILPRATPARSGVMHSMSSMPRALSQVAASFQFETPRFDPGSGGMAAFLEGAFWDLIMDFFAGMSHRLVVDVGHHSQTLAFGEGDALTLIISLSRQAADPQEQHYGQEV